MAKKHRKSSLRVDCIQPPPSLCSESSGGCSLYNDVPDVYPDFKCDPCSPKSSTKASNGSSPIEVVKGSVMSTPPDTPMPPKELLEPKQDEEGYFSWIVKSIYDFFSIDVRSDK